ncbi:MAG: ThuA domain-containing protein [Acidobacteria bacterium]|nr:ThuA domain-containing protein [Acidobacteriota bacterium]
MRVGLGRTLGQGLGLDIDFCDEVRKLTAAALKPNRLLIILRDGMTWPGGYPNEITNAAYVATGQPRLVSEPPLPANDPKPHYWITPEQGRAVRDFAQAGGGVLFLHNVTYISPHNEDFRDVLGAVTEGHPPIRTFRVRVTNREHPITKGVSDFTVTDEQHYVRYQKDARHLLLESVNEHGLDYKGLGPRSAAGWAYPYGKGRACYLAPGHLLTVLWNPEYEKLLRNAATWLMGG